MKKISSIITKHINLDEISFDLVITFPVIYIYNYFIKDIGLLERFGRTCTTHIVFMVEFFVGYYLGRMSYEFQFKEKAEGIRKKLQTILLVTFILLTAYTEMVIFVTLPLLLNVPSLFIFLSGFFMGPLGSIVGAGKYFFNEEKKRKIKRIDNSPKKKEKEPFIARLFNLDMDEKALIEHPVLVLPPVLLIYSIFFIVTFFGEARGLFAMLVFIGVIIIPVIVLMLSAIPVMVWISLYESVKKKTLFFDSLIKKIITPLFIGVILMLWEHIYLMSSIAAGKKASVPYILLILTFTGVIPVRIILALKPPIKWINILSGVCACGLYIYFVINIQ